MVSRSTRIGLAALAIMVTFPAWSEAKEPFREEATALEKITGKFNDWHVRFKQKYLDRSKNPPTELERLRRAGNWRYAPWASCPNPNYSGYYVGGGSWRMSKGEPRRYNYEGTWGWDYVPWWSKVNMHWWHGRYQAGEGQYEPDRKNTPLRDFTNPNFPNED